MSTMPTSVARIEDVNMNKMLFAIATSPFFSLMSIGITNVALPNIAVIFNENIETVKWITLSYLIILPIFIPIMSKIGGMIGFDKVHNIGLFLFAIASIFIVLSPSIGWMATFRGLQGIGAAMFQATNIVIVSLCFPKERRGKVLGYLSTSVALGSLVGPSLGGILIYWLPWQFLFLVHVPFVLICAYIAHRYIRIPRDNLSKSVDIKGAIQFSCLIVILMVAISLGDRWGWLSYQNLILLVLFMFIAMFLIKGLKDNEDPFIDKRLFLHSKVSIGIYISFSTYIIAFSIMAIAPFHLQAILGFSPYIVGFIMMAYPMFLAIAGPIFGSISDRYGSRKVILMGLSVMAVALAMMLMIGSSVNYVMIIVSFSLLGLGMGMITSPNYSMVMGASPKDIIGMAGGMIALARTLGMAIGTTYGLLLMNIWIPKDLGDVTNLLTEHNESLIHYSLMGFNTIYISMGLCCIFSIVFVGALTSSNKIKGFSFISKGG